MLGIVNPISCQSNRFLKIHGSVSIRARLEKLASAVRESGVSWHFGTQLGPPLTPRYHSAVMVHRLGWTR